MSWIDMDDDTYEKFLRDARSVAVWDHASGSYVTYPNLAGVRTYTVVYKWRTDPVVETSFETRDAAQAFVKEKRADGYDAYLKDNLYSGE